MKFADFLINEDRAYLGHKIGDILTAAHDLQQDLDNLGARQVARMADGLVDQIRRILHQQWKPSNLQNLKELQSVAVMIKKAIEEKKQQGSTYDLKETIKMAIQKLEQISGKMGSPVNRVEAPPTDSDLNQDDFALTSNSDGGESGVEDVNV